MMDAVARANFMHSAMASGFAFECDGYKWRLGVEGGICVEMDRSGQKFWMSHDLTLTGFTALCSRVSEQTYMSAVLYVAKQKEAP